MNYLLLVLSFLTGAQLPSLASYTRRDPAKYDRAWSVEAKHDDARSKQDCFCDQRPGTKTFWTRMLSQIRAGSLLDDSDPFWVHGVCAKAYPYIFKMVHAGEDDSFTLQTDCSAGLLSMLVVCARSTSLRGELDGLERSWVATPRVVVQEGEVLADYLEPMDARYRRFFKKCRRRCRSTTKFSKNFRKFRFSHRPYLAAIGSKTKSSTVEAWLEDQYDVR